MTLAAKFCHRVRRRTSGSRSERVTFRAVRSAASCRVAAWRTSMTNATSSARSRSVREASAIKQLALEPDGRAAACARAWSKSSPCDSSSGPTRRGRCWSPRRPARRGCRGPRGRGRRAGAPSRAASPAPPTRRRARSMIHLSTRMFSPKPGQRNLPSSPLRNQFTRKICGGSASRFCIVEPVAEVVAHVVAAEGQHRHRVAAHHADLAGGGGGGLRAHAWRRGRRRAPS